MHSNLFLNSSIEQNIPLSSFILIRSTCATLPWDPLNKFSRIIGRTCSDIFQSEDLATLIEYYLPIKEYLPGIHIPDGSAHACDDIQEVVKTKYTGTVSNKDILDLAFILEPAFIEGKTNIVFFGMANAFICRYEWCSDSKQLRSINDLHSFPTALSRSNGFPNSIKDTFPKHVFDWIGLFQERCRHVLCQYSERQGNFCHYSEEFNFPQDVWEYLCDCFHQNGVQLSKMPCRAMIWTKTLVGLCTVTMHVSKPFDHLAFKTELELNVLQAVFGTTCSMGLQQRWLKLGDGEKMLKWGDIINIIVPHTNGDRITRSGIQVNYNGSNMRLTINYEKYIYNRPGSEDQNLCPCPALLLTIRHNTPAITAAAPQEDDAALLQIETEFADINTGHVLVIRGVYDDRIEAEIIEPHQLNGEIVFYANHGFVAQCV